MARRRATEHHVFAFANPPERRLHGTEEGCEEGAAELGAGLADGGRQLGVDHVDEGSPGERLDARPRPIARQFERSGNIGE